MMISTAEKETTLPLYLYVCQSCGKKVDRIVSIDDRDDPCWHGEAVEGEACWGKMVYQHVNGNIRVNQYEKSRAEKREMKANGQVEAGTASYDEVLKHQADQKKAKEAAVDKFCKKKAEEFVTTYGEAIYTSENQNRSDIVERPKDLPKHIINSVAP